MTESPDATAIYAAVEFLRQSLTGADRTEEALRRAVAAFPEDPVEMNALLAGLTSLSLLALTLLSKGGGVPALLETLDWLAGDRPRPQAGPDSRP